MGGRNSSVKITMGMVEPSGPFIIKIGHGALFEDFRRLVVNGSDAIRIGRHFLWRSI
jgi:hypothetical protein